MKKITYWLVAFLLVASSCTSTNELQVRVGNPNDSDRQSEMVEIPVADVAAAVKLKDGETYIVKNVQGQEVPSQLTSDDKLIFQSGLKGKETTLFYIGAGTPQAYQAKTYGRFIQERADDFAWENDRVAFRAYGPSLVAIDGPSNGIDAWYKRTDELIIDKWYKNDLAKIASYHNDNGEGQDNYDVKRSLGAGGMAPYINDTLWLNENYAAQEVLDNGPLRTTFKLIYKDITANGNAFSESRTISIDAGSQLSKVVQEYGTTLPIAVAAGIVKRNGNDSIITSLENNYIIYAEPLSQVVDNVYLAMILPEGIEKSEVNTYTIEHAISKEMQTYSHILAATTYQPNKPVTYYTGVGWSKFGFPTIADWQKYVADFAANLQDPLVVRY
jgi:hypothetical protein